MNLINDRTELVLKRLEEPLSQEPSKTAWRQIIGALLHLDLQPSEIGWVDQIERSLSTWPDELRIATPALKRRLVEPPYPAWLSLVRVFDLIGYYSGWRDFESFQTFIEEGNIQHLYGFHNRYKTFGDEGVELLANKTSGMVELTLGNCDISNRGAQALCEADGFRNLQKLNLHDNKIGDELALRLLDSGTFPNLCYLNLANNYISSDVGTQICEIASQRGCKVIFRPSFR